MPVLTNGAYSFPKDFVGYYPGDTGGELNFLAAQAGKLDFVPSVGAIGKAEQQQN